jgi:hypothetical protein
MTRYVPFARDTVMYPRVNWGEIKALLWQWGRSQHRDRSRWLREREKCALLRRLRPGMIIRRMWEGEVRVVKCLLFRYQYRGKMYPTLYSVVVAIVGTRPSGLGRRRKKTSPWSAARFFQLKTLFS